MLGAGAARHPAPDPGLRGRRRNLRRQLDDPGARAVRPARLLTRASPCRACRPGRSWPRRCSCRSRTTCRHEAFNSWGWRIPFLLSFVVIVAGYIIRREVDETPAFAEEGEHGEVPKAPIVQAFKLQLDGHAAGRLHGADERHPGGRHHLRRGLRGPAGLRHRLPQGRLSVDPGARQHPGRVRHPLRRQPVGQDRPQAADHRRRARARACCRSAISTPSASTTCRWRSSCRC